MRRYVTYDPATGRLTGAFVQVPPPDHLAHLIEVTPDISADWPAYCANADRTGVELAPIVPQPQPVPESVEILQAEIALSRIGVSEAQIMALVDAMPAQAAAEARILWRRAARVHRMHPLVLAIGQALGYSADQLDDLFRAAAAISV